MMYSLTYLDSCEVGVLIDAEYLNFFTLTFCGQDTEILGGSEADLEQVELSQCRNSEFLGGEFSPIYAPAAVLNYRQGHYLDDRSMVRLKIVSDSKLRN